MSSFQDTQSDAYLELAVERARSDYLTWVEQVLDLIEERLGPGAEGSINDVGSNVGHFWKGLKRRDLRLDYRGWDLDEQYLAKAVELFPELEGRVRRLDITQGPPEPADVAVMSATLEHLEWLQPGLDNFLGGAGRVAVLRTFLGWEPQRSVQWVEGAPSHYYAHQYSFQEVLDAFARAGLTPTVVRDRHTDSMPIYMANGIVRAYHLVVGVRTG
jgi:hypothetical protein